MPLAPNERANVVRMDVPVAALITAGLPMRVHDVSANASADVLVGEDGRARAVRLLASDSDFLQELQVNDEQSKPDGWPCDAGRRTEAQTVAQTLEKNVAFQYFSTSDAIPAAPGAGMRYEMVGKAVTGNRFRPPKPAGRSKPSGTAPISIKPRRTNISGT